MGASATATVDVGRPPEIIEDYEDVSDMRVQTAAASGTFTFAMRPNPRLFTIRGRFLETSENRSFVPKKLARKLPARSSQRSVPRRAK